MIELTRQYGRYGYRRVAALLRDAGWHLNDKRIERLWRREGLKVPMKQPKKSRLWLNDGSCVRLRPECRDHVWSYDFVHHRTDDGKVFRTLNILDEFSRECLAIRVNRKLNSIDVIDVLTDLFILRGVPAFIRSDNGLSSLPRPFKNGSKLSAQRPPTSYQAHHGRTDTVKASMRVSGMNC
jgi:putative transposase